MYGPPSASYWKHGRTDEWEADGVMRWHQQVSIASLHEPLTIAPAEYNFALLGFASDEGVRRNKGRTGAAKGPVVLREAMMSLPFHWDERKIKIYDVGDVCCLGKFLEDAQEDLGDQVDKLLRRGLVPLLIGGGHEIAWGHFQGIARYFRRLGQAPRIGIINFDAHFDLRNYVDIGTSGTPFLQIARYCQQIDWGFHYMVLGVQRQSNTQVLFRRADELGVNYILSDTFYEQPLHDIRRRLLSFSEDKDYLYISCCLDVFAAAYAPGVSAVNGMGLAPWHVVPLLRALLETKKPFSFELAEFNPKYDTDGRTAKLAAALLFEVVDAAVKKVPAKPTQL